MSKYKIGDKFVIEIAEIFRNNEDDIIHEAELYRIQGFNTLVFDDKGLDKLQKYDKEIVKEHYYDAGYNAGLQDAWKLSGELYMLSTKKLAEIYGVDSGFYDLMYNCTVQEALAKLEAYEKSQQIQVGDVVEVNGDIAVITSFGTDDDAIHVIYLDGIVNTYRKNYSAIKKIGRHIDISNLLEQIRGNE